MYLHKNILFSEIEISVVNVCTHHFAGHFSTFYFLSIRDWNMDFSLAES